MKTNEVNETKVNAYVRQFSRLAETLPGSDDFEIEQAALDALWDSLSVEEKAVAYSDAQPHREKLQSQRGEA
jgi:uncharacterized protein YjaG (DUF416 family)